METSVRATLHWEQDYPRDREGYCFNPEGLFQPAEQRTEEQRKRVVFQLRGLTGIVSTWTHRERDNRQVERERGETQRVVDKEWSNSKRRGQGIRNRKRCGRGEY